MLPLTSSARGDILNHDLLSPHILLRDLARTSSVANGPEPQNHNESDMLSFLNYAEALLNQQPSGRGLLSPTTPLPASLRRSSFLIDPKTSKEAIDLAVMRSNRPKNAKLSTRFTISRSLRPVAVLFLPRSAYRLGETIHLVIDFSPPSVEQEPPVSPDSPDSAVARIQHVRNRSRLADTRRVCDASSEYSEPDEQRNNQ